MERHVEIGIFDADQFGHHLGGGVEAREIDGEMRKLATQPGREHLVRALAHRRGGRSERAASASPN
jgi:hypothetical protein